MFPCCTKSPAYTIRIANTKLSSLEREVKGNTIRMDKHAVLALTKIAVIPAMAMGHTGTPRPEVLAVFIGLLKLMSFTSLRKTAEQ